ncbi:MAG: PepSY domain-containing protein [Novosphingobium sp.]
MKFRRILTPLLLLALPLTAYAAPRRDPQKDVRLDTQRGEVMTLREIERRVLPTMPGMQYLGPEYDPAAMAYRLKFIRDGRVVFVDVDARSGQILHQSR